MRTCVLDEHALHILHTSTGLPLDIYVFYSVSSLCCGCCGACVVRPSLALLFGVLGWVLFDRLGMCVWCVLLSLSICVVVWLCGCMAVGQLCYVTSPDPGSGGGWVGFGWLLELFFWGEMGVRMAALGGDLEFFTAYDRTLLVGVCVCMCIRVCLLACSPPRKRKSMRE